MQYGCDRTLRLDGSTPAPHIRPTSGTYHFACRGPGCLHAPAFALGAYLCSYSSSRQKSGGQSQGHKPHTMPLLSHLHSAWFACAVAAASKWHWPGHQPAVEATTNTPHHMGVHPTLQLQATVGCELIQTSESWFVEPAPHCLRCCGPCG